MELKPIKTRRIYEEIVEQIKQLITDGELQPGDRLPSERQLAESLQVSRASVREALSAMEMMGILDVRSGEGTYIKHLNVDAVITPLALMISKEKDIVAQLLEVRKILEVQAVKLAAQRASEEDLVEMGEAIELMHKELEDEQLGDKADHRFHYAISRATHNDLLIRMIDAISDTMRNSLQTIRVSLLQGDTPKRLLKEHTKIYEAISANDSSLASELMLAHLVGAEQEMLQNIKLLK